MEDLDLALLSLHSVNRDEDKVSIRFSLGEGLPWVLELKMTLHCLLEAHYKAEGTGINHEKCLCFTEGMEYAKLTINDWYDSIP
jgi:hypothetical protein